MSKLNLQMKRKIAKKLQQYGRTMEDWARPTDKTKRFSALGANNFLLGVMLDRSVNAERAWYAAEWISEAMGDTSNPSVLWETLKKIEKRRLTGFLRYGYGGKAFHRHYKTFTRQLPEVATIILETYNGDPRKIWNNQRDVECVRTRLEVLPGIGPALSTMAVLILARNYGLLGGKNALAQLDIKPDVQVMRVFHRSGLIESGKDKKGAICIAKKLVPSFPAQLDPPAWEIGRNWCSPSQPSCGECPIGNECHQLVG